MTVITIVLRNNESTATHIYTYFANVVPRIGEFIEIPGHSPYEVKRIIHSLSNGNANIIVEVIKRI